MGHSLRAVTTFDDVTFDRTGPWVDPLAPPVGDDWLGLSITPLDIGAVTDWVTVPSCGGVVTFAGTVRDHAEGRDGVEELAYEAYPAAAVARLRQIADEARRRWPVLGRLSVLHRVGSLHLREVAVVAAASAPHRAEAFEAAQFLIDTVKETVPIWKYERWADGEGWGTCAHFPRPV